MLICFVQIVLTKVLFIREQPGCLWFNRMFSPCSGGCLYQTVFLNIFCKKLTFTPLVCSHSSPASWWKCNIHFLQKSPHSDAWVFHHFLFQLLDGFWCTDAIRMSTVFFPANHSLVVTVTGPRSKSYCFHGVQRALGSCHNCDILILV